MADIDELQDIYQKGNPKEQEEALSNLLILAGIDGTVAKEFIKNNFSTFAKELDFYGFTLKNPFIMFLQTIQKNKPNIFDSLLISSNYNVIHNAVSKNILDVNQIQFNCSEVDKPRLLLNPNFYNNSIVPDSDKIWLLQLWEWCASKDTKNYIRHLAVRLLFANLQKLSSSKSRYVDATELIEIGKTADFSSENNIFKLRWLLIYKPSFEKFLDDFDKVYNETQISREKILDVINTGNVKANINSMLTDMIISTKKISDIVSRISKDVSSSSRDLQGKYQRKQTDDDIEKTNNNTNKTSQRRLSVNNPQEANDLLNRAQIDTSKMSLRNLSPDELTKVGDALIYKLQNLRR